MNSNWRNSRVHSRTRYNWNLRIHTYTHLLNRSLYLSLDALRQKLKVSVLERKPQPISRLPRKPHITTTPKSGYQRWARTATPNQRNPRKGKTSRKSHQRLHGPSGHETDINIPWCVLWLRQTQAHQGEIDRKRRCPPYRTQRQIPYNLAQNSPQYYTC